VNALHKSIRSWLRLYGCTAPEWQARSIIRTEKYRGDVSCKPWDAGGVDDDIPVIVRMRVECARCGHAEDEESAFDLPLAKAQPIESYEPGTCPECGAPIHMHLKRWQRVQ
jgi:ribosomal protein S27AE